MPKNMPGVTLQDITGPHNDLLIKLGGPDGPEYLKNLKLLLRKARQLDWATEASLITQIGTIKVAAVTGFCAQDKIKKGTTDGVLIAYVSENLRTLVKGFGERMYGSPESELHAYKLCRDVLDQPIIDELGGEEAALTTFDRMWEMLKPQGEGQPEGHLLVNGYANIFYIREYHAEGKGALWAVYCDWYAGNGWFLFANPVSDQYWWSAGSQVFAPAILKPSVT